MHAIANDEGSVAGKPYLYVQIARDDDYDAQDNEEDTILPELQLIPADGEQRALCFFNLNHFPWFTSRTSDLYLTIRVCLLLQWNFYSRHSAMELLEILMKMQKVRRLFFHSTPCFFYEIYRRTASHILYDNDIAQMKPKVVFSSIKMKH